MKISVVIPSYESRLSLQACLLSLKHQKVASPHEFEVVVVDDGSTDGTDEMVAGLSLEFDLRYHYKPRTDTSGRAAARNTGIELASGELIVFVDADEVMPPGFLEQLLLAHLTSPDLVVLGARWYLHGGDLDHDALSREFSLDALPGISGRDPREEIFEVLSENLNNMATCWHYAFSCNLSVRREHLVAIGGFDEGFKGWGLEDSEIGYRLRQAGLSFVYHRDAILYHQYHEFSPAKLHPEWKQNLEYFCSKHPAVEVQLQWIMNFFFDPQGPRLDWLECCIRFELAARAAAGRLPSAVPYDVFEVDDDNASATSTALTDLVRKGPVSVIDRSQGQDVALRVQSMRTDHELTYFRSPSSAQRGESGGVPSSGRAEAAKASAK